MKLEELNRIYSDKVAEMLNAGWVIQPDSPTNGGTAIVFRRGDDYRVVYMNMHACDKNYQYHRAVRIGWGTPDLEKWVPGELLYIEDCREVTEHTYLEVGRNRAWFVTPQDIPAIIDKRVARRHMKRRVGMFRVFMGKDEIPSPEARRIALKLVRQVPGFGNTALKNIARVWFESGSELAWPDFECKPTLCVQVIGKGAECRIKMPCCFA